MGGITGRHKWYKNVKYAKKIRFKAGQAGNSNQGTLNNLAFGIFCASVAHLHGRNNNISISQKYYEGQFINVYKGFKTTLVSTSVAKVHGELNIQVCSES